MSVAMSSKLNKLIMKLIIAAAKGDKEKVYMLALELVKLFEEGLETEETQSGSQSKS